MTKPIELHNGPLDGMKVRLSEDKLVNGMLKIPVQHYLAIYGNQTGKWEFYGYDIKQQPTERGESSS